MRPTILWLIFNCCVGCAGGNRQLATCQAEKEQLLATIRTQRDSNQALNEQLASLESRLDQAEKALAQGSGATRFSKAATQPPTTAKTAGLSSKTEVLPWRNPEEKSASPADGRRDDRQAVSAKLASLARLDKQVKIDRASGTARLELPLTFHQDSDTLTSEDKRRLDDMARLLKSKEAKELPVIVSSGKGAELKRAKAVVEYLDRHGIARERLQVGTATESTPNSGEGRLVVDIIGSATPVAGLPESGERRR